MNNSINYSSFISISTSIEDDSKLNKLSANPDDSGSKVQHADFEQLRARLNNSDIEPWRDNLQGHPH